MKNSRSFKNFVILNKTKKIIFYLGQYILLDASKDLIIRFTPTSKRLNMLRKGSKGIQTQVHSKQFKKMMKRMNRPELPSTTAAI